MKCFHCDNCKQLVFFENTKCVKCNHILAYLPDAGDIGTMEAAQDNYRRVTAVGSLSQRYRLCKNNTEHHICNWAVAAEDPNPLCLSCRLTRVIPDISVPQNIQAWYRLEMAKRRLVYSLLNLRLPLTSKMDDPTNGVTFEFKADPPEPGAPRVLTGHDYGVITVNIAEADDAEREKRRVAMREPYRTSLGHFRHEIGHYYWDRLIAGHPRLPEFRKLFGDESRDYNEALAEYYKTGAPADWQDRFISAYSTAHPWEDWAESWAHYLHMVDALETAAHTGLALHPLRVDEPALDSAEVPSKSFDQMIEKWFPLTYILNNLNRGLGLADGYPFVLSSAVIEKLRFIHETISEC